MGFVPFGVAQGVLNLEAFHVLHGAINETPTIDLRYVQNGTNYVALALEQAIAGKPVPTPATRPYGCSVKHRD